MNRPELVIISAIGTKTRVIGKGMNLPWHISEDLKRFKALTSGFPVVMGKRTFDSLIHQLGKPLPGRRNIVLSHHEISFPQWDNAEVFNSIEKVLDSLADAERVFITGGATIYAAFLEQVDRLELTLVDGDHEGDVFFPPYEHLIGTMYKETARDEHDGFAFVTYERI
ncbi:MAG: dihydrofolate reductase [Bacteroidetes Order II. Incertae sedis bacterium]|jgi:dihydrofolate reductase|nr:dihydrofolate reductase [Bacteroidetes Order II. bacterium]MBT4603954.1 dihydrofolate reductase [Bacteroidetes Order II. bacterium]MBT5248909.1 dihydrofolate reductase [Bacteroidetes Order II. bacterium]MBT6200880.1 dihydrofolate reductase [Bacteroidetes Order II. bacterium]MBT6424087.1 dihydrofolate reductase [Bacteroidetes Order II. bacterium]